MLYNSPLSLRFKDLGWHVDEKLVVQKHSTKYFAPCAVLDDMPRRMMTLKEHLKDTSEAWRQSGVGRRIVVVDYASKFQALCVYQRAYVFLLRHTVHSFKFQKFDPVY